MVMISDLNSYRERIEKELLNNILPFWLNHTIDKKHGGFFGRISNDLNIQKKALKSALICSRILWAFSAAYQIYPKKDYVEMAQWAYESLLKLFWDEEFGGLIWEVTFDGKPVNTQKQIYIQAFGIYALSEYYKISHDGKALKYAEKLFNIIEQYAFDPLNQGYFEAFQKDWSEAKEVRLNANDLNEKKSMNTHLHILEAYTHLARVIKNPLLIDRLRQLILNFLEHIIDPQMKSTIAFFDEAWHPKSDYFSFGHDIEASWLLCEAAKILGDEAILKKVKNISVEMAEAVYQKGLDNDGAVLFEGNPNGIVDSKKEWWVQAEAIVGFLNAYEISHKKHFLSAALNAWDFIDAYLIDKKHGEWFRCVDRNRQVAYQENKVYDWKCPYHNTRMCLEFLSRVK